MTLKSTLITRYAPYHPWPLLAVGVVLSILGYLSGTDFGWWFSGVTAGMVGMLLLEPWRSSRRKRLVEERERTLNAIREEAFEQRERAFETALEGSLKELADESTQEIAKRLREGGTAVEVVNGELIFPDRSAQRP